MQNKVKISIANKREFEIIPGIDLPRLIEGDILISYPYSPSPRRELVIHADHWYERNKQAFVSACIREGNLEVRHYGWYRGFTNPTTKTKLNNADPEFVSYIEDGIKEN